MILMITLLAMKCTKKANLKERTPIVFEKGENLVSGIFDSWLMVYIASLDLQDIQVWKNEEFVQIPKL